MGRGKSANSLRLILAARDILKEIQPASVRAVCYQLFTRKLIPSMEKKYTNRVSTQLRDAREEGVIPWEWIVDETRAAECVNAWENPGAYVETVKRAYRRDRWTDQPYHLEVWSEKGTVRGTLAPVLDAFGVTFRVMHGYGSATTIHAVAEQSAQDQKTWIILYVGDWDPSGLHMSEVDLPERLARYGGQIARIHRVALRPDQLEIGLPWFPVEDKRGDARYAWYRKRFPMPRCWELDALSPVTLRDDVGLAICEWIYMDDWQRAEVAERAERESLATILDAWPGISGPASE
jgi:hypothetical protein